MRTTSFALVLACAACVKPLSPQDVQSLHDIKRDAVNIYDRAGAASADGQVARAAFCAAEAILLRTKSDAYDPSSGEIVCKVSK